MTDAPEPTEPERLPAADEPTPTDGQPVDDDPVPPAQDQGPVATASDVDPLG